MPQFVPPMDATRGFKPRAKVQLVRLRLNEVGCPGRLTINRSSLNRAISISAAARSIFPALCSGQFVPVAGICLPDPIARPSAGVLLVSNVSLRWTSSSCSISFGRFNLEDLVWDS